jgi:hypothetical protein
VPAPAGGGHLSHSVTRTPRTALAAILPTITASAPLKRCGVRLIPEDFSSRIRGRNRAGDPILCSVLHHMGFLDAASFARNPVGSYPAFSTLPRTTSVAGDRHSFSPVDLRSGAGRCIFCDTFRLPGLWSRDPPFFTGHAALRCSDFPLARQSEPATACYTPVTLHHGTRDFHRLRVSKITEWFFSIPGASNQKYARVASAKSLEFRRGSRPEGLR